MSTDNPWFDDRTPEDFILARASVTELTEETVNTIIKDSEAMMRRSDVCGLMSLIALDFEYLAPELINGKLKTVTGNRDKYQMAIGGTFEASNCDNYSMKVLSVVMSTQVQAKVTLAVSNSGDKQFSEYYGSEIEETIIIELYKGRPVISSLEIKFSP